MSNTNRKCFSCFLNSIKFKYSGRLNEMLNKKEYIYNLYCHTAENKGVSEHLLCINKSYDKREALKKLFYLVQSHEIDIDTFLFLNDFIKEAF